MIGLYKKENATKRNRVRSNERENATKRNRKAGPLEKRMFPKAIVYEIL